MVYFLKGSVATTMDLATERNPESFVSQREVSSALSRLICEVSGVRENMLTGFNQHLDFQLWLLRYDMIHFSTVHSIISFDFTSYVINVFNCDYIL